MIIKFHDFNTFFLKLLILSFVLPILPFFGGIRFDQILLYFLFIIDIIYFVKFPQYFNYEFIKFKVVLLMLSVLLLSVSSTIINYNINSEFSLASFENLFNPLCIIIIFYLNYSFNRSIYINHDHLLKYSLYFFLLNTFFAFFSIFYNVGDFMNSYLKLDNGQSVWHRSYALSRFIGFFGQPVEAGFAYSAFYLLFLKYFKSKSNLKYLLINLILIFGGVISTSKVFYITIVILILFRFFNYNKKIIYLIFIMSIPILYSFFIDVLKYFFATRYLETSNFLDDFLFIYNNNFLLGLGLRDTISDNPLDNAYLQIFLLSGFVGFIIYLLIIVYLVPRDNFDKKFSVYNTVFFVLIFLGGLGSPVLTLNKANFFIILFSFFNLYNSKKSTLL